jgi:hypothetical protein
LNLNLEGWVLANEVMSGVLLIDPDQVQLIKQVQDFLKTLLKRKTVDHPDLLFFSSEEGSKTYSMDTIRQIIQEANFPPYEDRFRYFVLQNADCLLPVHQNALLKVLEDHPPYAKFILLAKSIGPFLPTVLSRLKKIYCSKVSAPKEEKIAFEIPFSHFTQKAQEFDETQGIFETQDMAAMLESHDEEFLSWSLLLQKAEISHIKKKHLLEALYAQNKIDY